MNELTATQRTDLQTVARFIALYCREKHKPAPHEAVPVPEMLQEKRKLVLCSDCAELLAYGIKKRQLCPLDPKPACKNCHIHCYSAEYRRRIREIMAYSGKRMLLRGRLDYLWHYYFQK